MNPTRRRALWVAGLMGASALIAQAAKPTIHLADRIGKPDLETLFPVTFADWRIDTDLPVVLPSPDIQAKLDAVYNQVLARTYIDGRGRRIMLSVAYGGDQSDGTRAHRPEVCYPAQGFQIIENRRAELVLDDRVLPVRRLMSRMDTRHEPITYWFVVGGLSATANGERKLVELRYGLKGIIPDGMLVRISNIEPEVRKGFALHDEFIAAMKSAMPPADQTRVFGGQASV
jgi:EpsI family protein